MVGAVFYLRGDRLRLQRPPTIHSGLGCRDSVRSEPLRRDKVALAWERPPLWNGWSDSKSI